MNQPATTLDFGDADTGGTLGAYASAESYYRSLHLADVNGDGWKDLLIACARGA